MNDPRPSHSDENRCDSEFGSTRWSVVLTAGRASTDEAREALATLCQHYWYPLYAYVRRRSANADAAQDLIQEFFARLLEKILIGKADPQRGRFRSFLLTLHLNLTRTRRPQRVSTHISSIMLRARSFFRFDESLQAATGR